MPHRVESSTHNNQSTGSRSRGADREEYVAQWIENLEFPIGPGEAQADTRGSGGKSATRSNQEIEQLCREVESKFDLNDREASTSNNREQRQR
ncbi:hypothetical protein AJ79_04114 [Helicocarpus griseus UAMH5409]|uniref:Uncharacterized protein n=1 Tax=Helicocarpus griseus UAMH5409 TaxID=1447875 RepID=A0A2B7XVE0_9EURO|nr:hypothetical protein AJ79_04114 [Helicocarpus griseus UAMH5409]